MSNKRVANEVFMHHRGLTIYHVVDRNNNLPREFWYSTDEFGVDTGAAAFDVREVAFELRDFYGSSSAIPNPENPESHQKIIRMGVDCGVIQIRHDN